MCITEKGHILTCNHVVQDVRGDVIVITYAMRDGKLVKGESATAKIIYRDRTNDIAILEPERSLKGLKYLSLAKTDAKPGQRIFALGSPGLGSQQLSQSLSEGIVSSGERVIDGQKLVQHTAAVNPGNSGGPLVSEHGEIIGIVVIKANLENVAFAVPASLIRSLIRW